MALGRGTQEALSRVWGGHINEFKARPLSFLDFATQAEMGSPNEPEMGGGGGGGQRLQGARLLGGAVRDSGTWESGWTGTNTREKEAGQSLILRAWLLTEGDGVGAGLCSLNTLH